MRISEHDETPTIGKGIRWEVIVDQYCRVLLFTPFAEVNSGKIKQVSTTLPYASLLVESPKLFKKAYLPVVHKLDFRNLWSAFKERGINSEEEALVVYSPIKKWGLSRIFSGDLPSLVIQIYPKGALEKMHDYLAGRTIGGKIGYDALPKIITEWDARPEDLR